MADRKEGFRWRPSSFVFPASMAVPRNCIDCLRTTLSPTVERIRKGECRFPPSGLPSSTPRGILLRADVPVFDPPLLLFRSSKNKNS